MILRTARVEQTVDGDERIELIKELVVARVAPRGAARGSSHGDRGDVPLAMVRKRSAACAGGGRTLAPVVLIHGYGQNRYAWHLPARSFSNYLARAGFD